MPEMCETCVLQLVVRHSDLHNDGFEFRKSNGEHRRTLSPVLHSEKFRAEGRVILVHGGGDERQEQFRKISTRA